MDMDAESRTNNGPLMRPLEELEEKAYPAEGDHGPMSDGGVRGAPAHGIVLPTAIGQAIPAPAPDTVANQRASNNDEESS